MVYKNDTEKSIKVRTGNLKNYVWKTIKPGKIIDIPWFIAEGTGLSKVEEDVKKEEEVEGEKGNGERFREEEPEDSESYFKELVAIKGVGKKSAQEIVNKYSTRVLLVKAVQNGEEVHKHDGIDEAVKEVFGD